MSVKAWVIWVSGPADAVRVIGYEPPVPWTRRTREEPRG